MQSPPFEAHQVKNHRPNCPRIYLALIQTDRFYPLRIWRQNRRSTPHIMAVPRWPPVGSTKAKLGTRRVRRGASATVPDRRACDAWKSFRPLVGLFQSVLDFLVQFRALRLVNCGLNATPVPAKWYDTPWLTVDFHFRAVAKRRKESL